jgi:lycopene cyclase domain-containing protein
MPAYTALTVFAIGMSVVLDLCVVRTQLLFRKKFWLSLAIMMFFQVLADGWLTRSRGPIVIYNSDHFSGFRLFFNTPVEDFGFGFALILCTLSVWTRLGLRTEEP